MKCTRSMQGDSFSVVTFVSLVDLYRFRPLIERGKEVPEIYGDC